LFSGEAATRISLGVRWISPRSGLQILARVSALIFTQVHISSEAALPRSG